MNASFVPSRLPLAVDIDSDGSLSSLLKDIDEEKYADEGNRRSTTTCNTNSSITPCSNIATAKATPDSSAVRRQTKYRKKCAPCHRCPSTNESLIGIIKPSSYSQNASQPPATCAANRAKLHALRGANNLCDSFRLNRTRLISHKGIKQLPHKKFIEDIASTSTTTTADESFSSLDASNHSNSSLPSYYVTFNTSIEVYYFRR